MARRPGLLQAIRAAFERRQFRLTVHGLQEATGDEIAIADIRDAIMDQNGEILEDYPDDARGPSCLILAWMADERPLHVVVSHPPEVAVITAYVPDRDRWVDFRKRRRR